MSSREFARRDFGWRRFSPLVFACASVACAHEDPFIWYTTLPRNEWRVPLSEYVMQPGDQVTIRVYEQENLGGSMKIRDDGRIALPLLGEVMLAGKHPAAFAQELEIQLRRFIVTPRVTVNVESAHATQVTAVGELRSTGTIALDPPPTLLDAIAKAGGLSDFASDDHIFVVRQEPVFRRIRFTLHAIMNNENGAAGFLLRNGDVLLVE